MIPSKAPRRRARLRLNVSLQQYDRRRHGSGGITRSHPIYSSIFWCLMYLSTDSSRSKYFSKSRPCRVCFFTATTSPKYLPMYTVENAPSPTAGPMVTFVQGTQCRYIYPWRQHQLSIWNRENGPPSCRVSPPGTVGVPVSTLFGHSAPEATSNQTTGGMETHTQLHLDTLSDKDLSPLLCHTTTVLVAGEIHVCEGCYVCPAETHLFLFDIEVALLEVRQLQLQPYFIYHNPVWLRVRGRQVVRCSVSVSAVQWHKVAQAGGRRRGVLGRWWGGFRVSKKHAKSFTAS